MDHPQERKPSYALETPSPGTPVNHPQEVVPCFLEHNSRPNGAPFIVRINTSSGAGSMAGTSSVPHQPPRKKPAASGMN